MAITINSYNINQNTKPANKVSFSGLHSQKIFRYSNSNKLLHQPNIFEKGADIATDGFARVLGAIASFPPLQSIAEKLANSQNGMLHLSSAVSIILTGRTIKDIYRSKKIEEEQKLPLVLNEFLTTATTVTAGYVIDKKLDKGYKRFTDIFKNVNADMYAKNPTGWDKGLKYAKTFVVIGFIYRYLGPVVVTPIANRLSALIVNHSGKKEKQTAKA
jgi:hypothetical protein